MCRLNTGLAKILGFYFLEFGNMLLYMLKEILQVWLSSGSRSERLSLDYPGGPIVITRVLVRQRLEGQSQKKKKKKKSEAGSRGWSGALWRWREGTASLRTQVTSENWKRQRNEFSPENSRRNATLVILWFYTSDLQYCKRINLCCFKSLNLW